MKGDELKKILDASSRGSRADLRYASLRYASLRGASLRDADLCGADLCGADLRGASLRCADLCGADLRDAILRDASLRYANLRYANLRNADLRGADLRGAKLPAASIVPEEGSFIAWKSVSGTLVRLYIPGDAERVGGFTCRKCRASKAECIWIDGKDSVKSKRGFTYTVGELAIPDKWDPDIRVECTHGIHFYITKQEAIESGF